MKTANLSNDQLETALNATRILLNVDTEELFLSSAMYKAIELLEKRLYKESVKRNLDI